MLVNSLIAEVDYHGLIQIAAQLRGQHSNLGKRTECFAGYFKSTSSLIARVLGLCKWIFALAIRTSRQNEITVDIPFGTVSSHPASPATPARPDSHEPQIEKTIFLVCAKALGL